MIVFLILLLLVSLYKIRFTPFNENYMSRESTASINGIFIIMAFLSHVRDYITLPANSKYSMILYFIGQLMVAMFLFYSGYGVMESYKNKPGYADKFLKNRFLKTLLHFDIAVFLFLIIAVVFGKQYPARNYVLCWVGWEAIGNSNWFIFVILSLYLLTWLCFLVSDKEHLLRLCILQTALTLCLIVFMKAAGKDSYWYDTAMCYPTGIWFSFFKDRIDKALSKKAVYYPALAILIVGLYILHRTGGMLHYCLYTAEFSLLTVVITMKVEVGNGILSWFGNHLFEIYILQRIPMILLSKTGLGNPVLFTTICLIATVLIAVAFKKLLSCIDKKLFSKG